MTLRERVIVEVHTGYVMTHGDERNEVYKYIAEIVGRPVYTHGLIDERMREILKNNSRDDFIQLCKSGVCSIINCNGVRCDECKYNDGDWWYKEYIPPEREGE